MPSARKHGQALTKHAAAKIHAERVAWELLKDSGWEAHEIQSEEVDYGRVMDRPMEGLQERDLGGRERVLGLLWVLGLFEGGVGC